MGWSGRGSDLGATLTTPKTPKNFIKCLIFNGLVFWGSFGVALGFLAIFQKTCYNKTQPTHQLLDFQRFENIKQVLVPQGFYGGAKQGIGRVVVLCYNRFLSSCQVCVKHA